MSVRRKVNYTQFFSLSLSILTFSSFYMLHCQQLISQSNSYSSVINNSLRRIRTSDLFIEVFESKREKYSHWLKNLNIPITDENIALLSKLDEEVKVLGSRYCVHFGEILSKLGKYYEIKYEEGEPQSIYKFKLPIDELLFTFAKAGILNGNNFSDIVGQLVKLRRNFEEVDIPFEYLFKKTLPAFVKEGILTEVNMKQIFNQLLDFSKRCMEIEIHFDYLPRRDIENMFYLAYSPHIDLDIDIDINLIDPDMDVDVDPFYIFYSRYLGGEDFSDYSDVIDLTRMRREDYPWNSYLKDKFNPDSFIFQKLFPVFANMGFLTAENLPQVSNALIVLAKECIEAGLNPNYLFYYYLPTAGVKDVADFLEIGRKSIDLWRVYQRLDNPSDAGGLFYPIEQFYPSEATKDLFYSIGQSYLLFRENLPSLDIIPSSSFSQMVEFFEKLSVYHDIFEFFRKGVERVRPEGYKEPLFTLGHLTEIAEYSNIFVGNQLSEMVELSSKWTEAGLSLNDLFFRVLPFFTEKNLLTEDNLSQVGFQILDLSKVVSKEIEMDFYHLIDLLIDIRVMTKRNIFEIGTQVIEVIDLCKYEDVDYHYLFDDILKPYVEEGYLTLTESNFKQISRAFVELLSIVESQNRPMRHKNTFLGSLIPYLLKTGILTEENISDLGIEIAENCEEIKPFLGIDCLFEDTIPALVQKGIVNESNVIEIVNEFIKLGNSLPKTSECSYNYYLFHFTIPVFLNNNIITKENISLVSYHLLNLAKSHQAYIRSFPGKILFPGLERILIQLGKIKKPSRENLLSIFEHVLPQFAESGYLNRDNIIVYLKLLTRVYEAKASLNIFRTYGIDTLIQRTVTGEGGSTIISSDYTPGLYSTLGELQEGYQKRYNELINEWVLELLLKAEVKGYFKFYFQSEFPETRGDITKKIKNPIRGMTKEEIAGILLGECDNPISGNIYRIPNTLIESLTVSQLESFYINREVEYYIFGPEEEDKKTEFNKSVAEQIRICIDIIKEAVEYLFTIDMGDGKRLIDRIDLAEAAFITRQVAEILLRGGLYEGKQIRDFFDAENYKSMEANRWCYFSIPRIQKDLANKYEELLFKADSVMQVIDSWDGWRDPSGKLAEALDYLWPGFSSIEARRLQLKRIIEYNPNLVRVLHQLGIALGTPELKPDISEEDVKKLVREIAEFNNIYSLAVIAALGNVTDTSEPARSEEFLSDPIGYLERLDGFYLSSFIKFYQDIIRSDEEIKLAYFTDNNGEAIFDLLFISELLRMNPHLKITIVPKRVHVGNDLSYDTLENKILGELDRNNRNYFDNIRASERVTIVDKGPILQGVDFRDPELQEIIEPMDVVLFKGQGNFQTSQGLNKPRYYIFMVKSESMEEATGLASPAKGDTGLGPLVFCYIEPGAKVGTGLGNAVVNAEIPNIEEIDRREKSFTTAEYTLWNYYRDHPNYYDPRE